MGVKSIILTCLLACGSTFATFSAPKPIPFHASPIFLRSQEARDKQPASLLPFFVPPPQQKQNKPAYPGGFIPLHSFGVPPPNTAPLPWETTQQLPAVKTPTQAQSIPLTSYQAPVQHPQSLGPVKVKSVKDGSGYPKKWIPITNDGKKIKPKNVEKRMKQIVVSSSTTTKHLSDKDLEEEQKNADILREFQKPKTKRVPIKYQPLPLEEAHPQPVNHPLSFNTGVQAESAAYPEIRHKPKPYAHNHQQATSGSGFTPHFAAEASGTHLGAESAFVGHHQGIHPIGDGSGDRVHFHIHGEKGPKSYRFGYDTGKGPDRHFRYEERDDHGNVKGHFGFYDKHGKLQVVHYSADPKNGYSADGGNFGKHEVL